MATKFVTNLDLVQNQILNGRFESVASDPAVDNFEGRLIYNTTEDTIKVYSGSAWRKMLHGISSTGSASEAITISESNGAVTITPNLATSSDDGVMSAADKLKLDDATADATASKLVIRDSSGNAKVATPTDAAHIATKGYVDAARQGLDVKQSVRVATTAPINLATDLQAGDTIDGITLVAGDRVLVKNQGTASENGIYVAVASGAASRSSDANGTPDTGEITSGTFVFVETGTVNFDSGFVVTTDGTITVGTTGITWTQFSGAGSFEAGDGLSKSGTQVNVNVTADRTAITADAIDIASTYVGQSSITTLGTISTGTWEATDVGIAYGGTNASTESAARQNLAAGGTQGSGVSTPTLARVINKTIGNNSATSFTIEHGFATRDVIVQVYDAATYDTVICDVVRTDTNTVTCAFSVAPASNAYKVVITG
jgi:hypothetical protein